MGVGKGTKLGNGQKQQNRRGKGKKNHKVALRKIQGEKNSNKNGFEAGQRRRVVKHKSSPNE